MSQTKGKLVRVSDDTMQMLAKERNGFETPNDCINRLLSKDPCKNQMKEQTEEKNQEPDEEEISE